MQLTAIIKDFLYYPYSFEKGANVYVKDTVYFHMVHGLNFETTWKYHRKSFQRTFLLQASPDNIFSNMMRPDFLISQKKNCITGKL